MTYPYGSKSKLCFMALKHALLTVLAGAALFAFGCADRAPEQPGVSGAGGGGAVAGTGAAAGMGSGGTAVGGWGGTGGYPNLWVSVYYPGWTENELPVDRIDFSALTHLIHFSLAPTPEGGLDESTHNVSATSAAAVVAAAHNAGKKVLIAVGGAKLDVQFASAISDPYRATFINNLISLATSRGYDGIDIDMEPIKNRPLFHTFSRELRAAIDANAPELLLTTAGLGADGRTFGPVADVYDQINIMTYDLVYGPDTTWHNSALSGGSGQYYSADRAASEYAAAGVPAASLGIGIECFGYTYGGATGPKQAKTSGPTDIPYTAIAPLLATGVYTWDEQAWAPFLVANNQFITFDDPRLASEKVHFVGKKGYGGVIVWDPSLAYFPSEAVGKQHPLLQAVKEAAFGP